MSAKICRFRSSLRLVHRLINAGKNAQPLPLQSVINEQGKSRPNSSLRNPKAIKDWLNAGPVAINTQENVKPRSNGRLQEDKPRREETQKDPPCQKETQKDELRQGDVLCQEKTDLLEKKADLLREKAEREKTPELQKEIIPAHVGVDTQWFKYDEVENQATTSAGPASMHTHPTSVEPVPARNSEQKTDSEPNKNRGYSHGIIQLKDSPSKDEEIDSHAPAPVPLHIIQAYLPHPPQQAHHPKTKLSRRTWSLSDNSSQKKDTAQKDHDNNELQSNDGIIVNDFQSSWDTLESWMEHATTRTPTDPLVAIKEDPLSHQFDIDTKTGKLIRQYLPVVTYASLDATYEGDEDMAWRQMNMTSSLRIKNKLEEVRSLRQQRANRAAQLSQQKTRKLIEMQEPEPESQLPRASCTLRPATKDDLEEIAAIINLERQVSDCPQILESKEATRSQVDRILESCHLHMRPFIVAVNDVEDILLDHSKWPAGSHKAWADYVKFKQTQPQKLASVVGFAWVSESRIGFFNVPCPGSRHTGQVRLAVHPEYRRNLYGSALLDRILLMVSPYHHRSLVDYKWDGPEEGNKVYDSNAHYNHRQYNRIFIETFIKDERDAPVGWRAKMLKEFEFTRTAYFQNAVRTDRGHESEWLDLALWECEVDTRLDRFRDLRAEEYSLRR